MVGQFIVEQRREGDALIIEVCGELDIATEPHLRKLIDTLYSSHPGTVIVDLTALSFVDSTGIALLLDAVQTAPSHAVTLTLVPPPAPALRAFEICGIDDQLFGNTTDKSVRTANAIVDAT